MSDNTLEQRVRRLEDIEAIKGLTALYADHVNKGWNGKQANFDQLPALFAEDARWNCPAMNVHAVGRDEIVQTLRGLVADIDFAMHSFTNPVITVDGDTATGSWLLWVGVKTGEKANEVFQSEELRYVRTPLGWRIQLIDLYFGTTLNA